MNVASIDRTTTDTGWRLASTQQTVGTISIMPDPRPLDAVGGDPMAMLYAALSQQRNADLATGRSSVKANDAATQGELHKEQDALAKQEQDEQNAAQWGIFAKVASVVAIAVSALASVFSFGAASGLCAAACVLSTLAFAEGEGQVLTKLTGNPDADKAFQIGAGIAAAICSCGAGIANLGVSAVKTVAGIAQIAGAACTVGKETVGAVKDKGCQDAAMALGIGGAACSLAGGVAGGIGDAVSDAESAIQSAVKAAADCVGGAAEVGGGVATIVSGVFTGDATDRGADAKQAQLRAADLEQLASWLIDGLKQTDNSHRSALQTLQGAIQTKAQTCIIASGRV